MPDSIVIAADDHAVWPLVADPVEHARWNDKVISIGRERNGPVTLGERFEMIYRLKGRTTSRASSDALPAAALRGLSPSD